MNTANVFGRILKQLREDNDLTQEQLCDELQNRGNRLLNKSTISRWEHGTRKPQIEIIRDLEGILGTEQDRLLTAAGYIIGTTSTQLVSFQTDPIIVKQREEHFANLAKIATSLLSNGLDSTLPQTIDIRVSASGEIIEPSHVEYIIENRSDVDVPQILTKEQLSAQLEKNLASAHKKYTRWFIYTCFIPHLEAELPEEVKAKGFWVGIIDEMPYELIETLRLLVSRKTFKGTCPVCEDWF